MQRRGALSWKPLGMMALGAMALAPATPVFAAGFAIFEQGARVVVCGGDLSDCAA